jgi:enoyl-CoA hydratase/carnithine racemase
MSTVTQTRKKCDFFSYTRVDEVGIIRFRDTSLFPGTDLAVRDQVLDCMESVSNNPNIKVLIMFSSPEKTGRDQYLEFFGRLANSKAGITPVHRLCNVFHQFILSIVESGKLIIHANCGKVITLLLNVSLACDFRIVSSDTVFQNPYLELGLVPLGGGPYFLTKRLGQAAAYKVLFSDTDITAREALELGMVDKVAPPDELEDAALTMARSLAKKPERSLSGVKRLVNMELKDLKEFLDREQEILVRCVETSGLLGTL